MSTNITFLDAAIPFPEPFEFVDPEVSFTFDIWYQLATQT